MRNVSIGQIVSTSGASPLLYRIATDLQRLEINVEIPRDELAELRSGSDVLVTTDVRNGHERHGTVSRVALTTTVDIPNADLQWRPGTAVTATIVLERKDNVLRVPSNALTSRHPKSQRRSWTRMARALPRKVRAWTANSSCGAISMDG